MKLRCEITRDDLVAHALWYLGRSPAVRRKIRIHQWSWPLILLAIFGLEGLAIGTPTAVTLFVCIGIATTIVWVLNYPRHYWSHIGRETLRRMDERSNGNDIWSSLKDNGAWSYELELAGDMLVARNRNGEQNTSLSAIQEIQSNGIYLFIEMEAGAAYIIPLDKTTEGNPLLFRDALQRRIDGVKEAAIRAL